MHLAANKEISVTRLAVPLPCVSQLIGSAELEPAPPPPFGHMDTPRAPVGAKNCPTL